MMRASLKAVLICAGCPLAVLAEPQIVNRPQSLKVETATVSAAAPKPVINRLDAMDVYKLAPSAYLLKSGHMLSMELYAGIKSRADVAEFADEIQTAARQSGVPQALIAAIIMTESGFDPKAVSSAGAQGLMQLMPATLIDLKVEDPYDAEANIQAGAAYLKAQLEVFQDLDLALAAYNAGPANVKKYGRVPPFPETVNFIKKVRAYYQEYASVLSEERKP